MKGSKFNMIEFLAPRGTVIAEDTRGLHKGRHVEEGDRLMLQLQFSNVLFGCSYRKSVVDKNDVIDELRFVIDRFPKLYMSYLE